MYERIWKVPATKLAKELGISDVALAKICRKLNVPKPGPGHWRLVQLGFQRDGGQLVAVLFVLCLGQSLGASRWRQAE